MPEHNKANYIDAVIEDAVDYWSPYAHLLTVIGYGNHETAIIKNLETDPDELPADIYSQIAEFLPSDEDILDLEVYAVPLPVDLSGSAPH